MKHEINYLDIFITNPHNQLTFDIFRKPTYTEYCSVYSHCYATTARWADMSGLFLDNGWVNTIPLLGSRLLIMQQLEYNKGARGSVVC
jgi:hypothetical protein